MRAFPTGIVQRYITMRPKLEASKDLKKIVSILTQTTGPPPITTKSYFFFYFFIFKCYLIPSSLNSPSKYSLIVRSSSVIIPNALSSA